MYLDKRKLVSYTVLAFVLGSFLGGTMWNFAGVYLPKLPPSDLLTSSSLMKFGSSEELANFIGTRPQEYYYDYAAKGWGTFPSFRGGMVMEAADAASSASTDYSGTNIQVEGVDAVSYTHLTLPTILLV